MRRRSAPRGFVVAVAGVAVAAAIAAVNGDVGASARAERPQADASLYRTQPATAQPAAPVYSFKPGYERARRIYQRMNQRAEELRREVNKTSPDPAVVADLKVKLRSLANQL